MGLQIALLGTFEIRRDGQLLPTFRSQSVRALLAYLAIESNRAHEREHLANLLWPNESINVAMANLRQALHRLREAIEPPGAEDQYLLINRQTVQLNPAQFQLDITKVQTLLKLVVTHRHRHPAGCAVCLEHLQAAANLLRGDVMSDVELAENEQFENWLYERRESIRTQAAELFNALAVYHEWHGLVDVALDLLRRWTELEPWSACAQTQLITLLSRCGRRAAALRQAERYRCWLSAELGIEPSLIFQNLVSQIRLHVIPQRTNVLRHAPAVATPLIDRAAEQAFISTLLNDPTCHLITITGPGGSGKTRLALEVATKAGFMFADGAAFVDLTALHHAWELPQLLAQRLRLLTSDNQPLWDQVCEQLKNRQLLLVLDNCEQVAGLSKLLIGLMTAAPQLVILATSRTPINLRSEWLLPIDGLRLPLHGDVIVDATNYAAGQLFLEVVQRQRPGFTPDADDSRLILECCRLLEGLPLGIVLAANRLVDESLEKVVRDIRSDFNIPAGITEHTPSRHRSLRANFNWSWHLLSPREQQTLIWLADFDGECDRNTALAICGPDAALDQLIYWSLVRRDHRGRYLMHMQTRHYARQQREQPEDVGKSMARHDDDYLEPVAA